jgi:hypothetical protein
LAEDDFIGIGSRYKLQGYVYLDDCIEAFLERLIELGVDVIQSLEPLTNVDLHMVTDTDDNPLYLLSFLGAIDIKDALQGDTAHVTAEEHELIQALAHGGGVAL